MSVNTYRQSKDETVFRRADVNDLPACAEIINDFIDVTDWLPRIVTREQINQMFFPDALERRTILIAEKNNEVAGYASLEKETSFLHALYLKPDARDNGIGKQLLDEVKLLSPDGFELTVWEPNQDARRFYLREGFVEIPDGYKTDTDDGVPTILMRWETP